MEASPRTPDENADGPIGEAFDVIGEAFSQASETMARALSEAGPPPGWRPEAEPGEDNTSITTPNGDNNG